MRMLAVQPVPILSFQQCLSGGSGWFAGRRATSLMIAGESAKDRNGERETGNPPVTKSD
jgi:hypothetical protein